jgi:prepilin-type N-terminal cleavage/methylation domain-containing protein
MARPTRGRATAGFTIIELLIVMAIILVLTALILATSGYVQNKGARSRAEAEIAALSAALESYKADNGIYPSNTSTDALKPNSQGDPAAYKAASLFLYKELSGDHDANRTVDSADKSIDSSGVAITPPLTALPKTYFQFKPTNLLPSSSAAAVTAISDPFGNSYGYSTVKSTNPAGTDGYNPTFDLWSTAGISVNPPTPPATDTVTPRWVKNW